MTTDNSNSSGACQLEVSSDRTFASSGAATTNSGGAAMDNVVLYILIIHTLTRTTLLRSGTTKNEGVITRLMWVITPGREKIN